MENQLIIYPAVIHIILILYLYIRARSNTVKAYKNREINKVYPKLYQGESPDYLENSRQTLKNQFELPIIFYFLISLIVATGRVTFLDIIFAWLFVISRYIHCYVRLSSNYVPHRSKVFIGGVMFLTCGWINFLVNIYP